VGELLQKDGQILPDTYLGRGEVVRRMPDDSTRFLSFDVAKALAGDPVQDLGLQDRDAVELYRMDDLRLRRTLTVVGPVQRPGEYEFHEDMRVSDLLFRSGVLQSEANRLVAELAHSRDGHPSQVIRLDLTRLLSSETTSPVTLLDDAVNPKLEPFDQLSLFVRPDFHYHRCVTLSGQVARPGVYALDSDHVTLKELVARAGGLTAQSMPRAAIFLRQMGEVDPEREKGSQRSGLQKTDPTSQGINEILSRLSETLRQPLSGQLLSNSILHGLQAGTLSRLVVDVPALLAEDPNVTLEFQDGDEIIFPRLTQSAYVVGETASPFAVYGIHKGQTVSDLLSMAGGPTRNADTSNIRLLKADGRILDHWIKHQTVEPGDTVLVPQLIRRDSSWQENLTALTPIAILLNAIITRG
jgi:protein involved in polysaccharide export with SLBB domain